MPTYEIEQYELYSVKYRVEASDKAEAIAKRYGGEGEAIDNSLEYIEVADEFGMPVEGFTDLAEALQNRGIRIRDDFIPSIRSIEEA